MTKKSKLYFVLQFMFAVFVLSGAVAYSLKAEKPAAESSKKWTDKFNLSSCTWSSTGKNDYFILEPGYQAILEGRDYQDLVRLEITVFKETKVVGNVETRIVEEKESRNGELIEISLNFFAICAPSNDVFYFGEEVDFYKGGKVVGHEGSWVAEKSGAKAGLFMPARPLLGARYYQEIAPDVAMDRVEVVTDAESLKTPAGEFRDCLKTEETTPLEPGVTEYKTYSKGIGIIQDGNLLLRRYGSVVSKKQ